MTELSLQKQSKQELFSQDLSLHDFNIAIIGAGWVGKPLAFALQEQGAKVVVTGSQNSSLQALTNEGLNAIKVSLPLVENGTLPDILLKQQCLVICIPPGLRYGKNDYQQKISNLIEFSQSPNSQVKHVIMLSSTAVYNGLIGEVNEESQLDMTANKVAAIVAAEQAVLGSHLPCKTVVRLGGLIGYNRHPGQFFKNGRSIANPNSVVNFIHRDDVIGLLKTIIKHNISAHGRFVFNGVADCHPTREFFYKKAIAGLSRAQPEFLEQTEEAQAGVYGKQVMSIMNQKLGYQFVYNNLLQWLELARKYHD